jgi:NADH:ubiquinone oxidoreductase subunit H
MEKEKLPLIALISSFVAYAILPFSIAMFTNTIPAKIIALILAIGALAVGVLSLTKFKAEKKYQSIIAIIISAWVIFSILRLLLKLY